MVLSGKWQHFIQLTKKAVIIILIRTPLLVVKIDVVALEYNILAIT